MAFTEVIRGKYEIDDKDFIKNLISNMTFEEQDLLKTSNFTELWTIHWGVGRDHHSNEYEISKSKFDLLNITELINSQGYNESEWGFPKGRRQHRESDINCAVREFSEETNISKDDYIICKNLVLDETFKGTNNINYKHIYFIALSKDSLKLKYIMTDEQSREISEISWKSLSECEQTTRPHYIQRFELLKNLKIILKTFHSNTF
jgi:8-oxo-dGTP pyrophosphatase MutT (NUDIX family)